eukprot:scaffold14438_cov77-Skeletonema_dohrnii-CCMP3373.AAC.1
MPMTRTLRGRVVRRPFLVPVESGSMPAHRTCSVRVCAPKRVQGTRPLAKAPELAPKRGLQYVSA